MVVLHKFAKVKQFAKYFYASSSVKRFNHAHVYKYIEKHIL